MLIKFRYRNHKGESINFGENGVYVNANDLYDYKWQHTAAGNRISGLHRNGVVEKSIPIVIAAQNQEAAANIRNHIFSVTENDVISNKPGTIIINGYSYSCFIIGAKHTDWYDSRRHMNVELAVISDSNMWIREHSTLQFNTEETDIALNGDGEAETNTKKYPFGYPYRYADNGRSQVIYNGDQMPLDMRLSIFGACRNPAIIIGGNVYALSATLAAGERIIVDGYKKTITKIDGSGTQSNCFSDWTNMDNYIFQPLATGENTVAWDGTFGFCITPIEKRSMPLWE